ncbi:MAG: carboxypeptidase [Clostridia bacterium]|nr:carboxypeptidase [Clostridia bacterium]
MIITKSNLAVNCKEKEGESVNSAKVIQVIQTKSTRGKGTDADPVREVTQYWDFEGNLICEKDSLTGE